MGHSHSKKGDEYKYTKPTGLYPHCEWDDKVVKKMIVKRKIAPRYPGQESGGPDLEECPICFLNYPGGLNRAKCCRKPICTECFLQLKKPRSTKPAQCPFCNAGNYSVRWLGALTAEEKEKNEMEDQRVIEAQMRIRKEEEERQEQRAQEVADERTKRMSMVQAPVAAEGSDSPFRTAAHHRHSLPNVSSRDPSVDTVLGTQRQLQQQQPSNSTTSSPAQPASSQSQSQTQAQTQAQQQAQHMYHHFYHHIDHHGANGEIPDVDVEELMVMEAIRRSLADTVPASPGSRTHRSPADQQRRKERRERRARREAGETDSPTVRSPDGSTSAAFAAVSHSVVDRTVQTQSPNAPSTPQASQQQNAAAAAASSSPSTTTPQQQQQPPNSANRQVGNYQPSEAELDDDELALAMAIRLSLMTQSPSQQQQQQQQQPLVSTPPLSPTRPAEEAAHLDSCNSSTNAVVDGDDDPHDSNAHVHAAANANHPTTPTPITTAVTATEEEAEDHTTVQKDKDADNGLSLLVGEECESSSLFAGPPSPSMLLMVGSENNNAENEDMINVCDIDVAHLAFNDDTNCNNDNDNDNDNVNNNEGDVELDNLVVQSPLAMMETAEEHAATIQKAVATSSNNDSTVTKDNTTTTTTTPLMEALNAAAESPQKPSAFSPYGSPQQQRPHHHHHKHHHKQQPTTPEQPSHDNTAPSS